MTAVALLEAVAKTYDAVRTMAAELTWLTESEDDGSFNRSWQYIKAFFVAPDKVRLEQGGRQGLVLVTDGNEMHSYFTSARRYTKTSVTTPEQLPGFFRPDFPIDGNRAFLFNGIAQRISRAELQGEDTVLLNGSQAHCHVVSVVYDPPPHPGFAVSSSPVLFWIGSNQNLILRMEGSVTHRFPAHEEAHTAKTIMMAVTIATGDAIAPETFEYTPPAHTVDALDPLGRAGCVSGSGGGGGSSIANGNRYEAWHSHDWAGPGTLVETSKLKFETLNLSFERRLTFAEDRKSLQIQERVNGPKGATEHSLSIPLD